MDVSRKREADTQNVAAYVSRLAEEHAVSVSSAAAGAEERLTCDVKLVANLTKTIACENKERLQAGMIIADGIESSVRRCTGYHSVALSLRLRSRWAGAERVRVRVVRRHV